MFLVLNMFVIRVTREQSDRTVQETLENVVQEVRICDLTEQPWDIRKIGK